MTSFRFDPHASLTRAANARAFVSISRGVDVSPGMSPRSRISLSCAIEASASRRFLPRVLPFGQRHCPGRVMRCDGGIHRPHVVGASEEQDLVVYRLFRHSPLVGIVKLINAREA